MGTHKSGQQPGAGQKPVPAEVIEQERRDVTEYGGSVLRGGDPESYNYATGRRGGMQAPAFPSTFTRARRK